MTFSSIDEVVAYVTDALGDFAEEYDVEAIARSVSEWQEGELRLAIEDPDERFWQIAEEHELSR